MAAAVVLRMPARQTTMTWLFLYFSSSSARAVKSFRGISRLPEICPSSPVYSSGFADVEDNRTGGTSIQQVHLIGAELADLVEFGHM